MDDHAALAERLDDAAAARRVGGELEFAAALADRDDETEAYERAVEALRAGLDAGDDPGSVVDAVEDALAPIADRASEYAVHYAGHAHLDLVFWGAWDDTVDAAYRTFGTMLDLMDDYPEFRFTASTVPVYRALEEHAPEQFARIRDRVEEGRWEPAAGTWVEADKNMASGESQVRQVLEARRYLVDRFDRTSRVDLEPDTFGHPATTPEVLAGAGVDYYYFCRGGGPDQPDRRQGVYGDLPRAFRWRGPAGSEVVAWNGAEGGASIEGQWYNGRVDPGDAAGVVGVEEETGLRDLLVVYGVGDHGGGPTREDVELIAEMREWPVYPEVRFTTLEEFFDRIAAADADLPVVEDELNFAFRGGYSSQSRAKAANRRLEDALPTAETLALAGARETDLAYPVESLQEAWRETLFGQFHDTLAGTGRRHTYDDAMGRYQRAEAAARLARDRGLDAVTGGTFREHGDREAGAGGVRVAAYDPLPWERTTVVEATVYDHPEWDRDSLVAVGPDGEERPVEVLETEAEVRGGVETGDYGLDDLPEPPGLLVDSIFGHSFTTVAFEADLPATGYAAYELREGDAGGDGVDAELTRTGAVLESERYRLEFEARSASVTSLYDRRLDREFVADGERFGLLSLEHERPHMMSAWIRDQVTDERPLDDGWEVTAVEGGPVRGVVRFERSVGDSDLAVEVALRAGGRAVEWTVDADWNEVGDDERGVPVLRARFPTAVDDPAFGYEVPFGHRERPPDGKEVPAQRWADLSDADSGAGVTISNDTTYGHAAEGDALLLTLLRSSYGTDTHPEAGRRTLRWSVRPHAGGWSAGDATRHGLAFHRRPETEQLRADPPADRRSFLRVGPASVVATAFKPAEDGDGAVVRLREAAGEACEATVETRWDVAAASAVDHLERETDGDVAVAEGTVRLPMDPGEVRTVRLSFD